MAAVIERRPLLMRIEAEFGRRWKLASNAVESRRRISELLEGSSRYDRLRKEWRYDPPGGAANASALTPQREEHLAALGKHYEVLTARREQLSAEISALTRRASVVQAQPLLQEYAVVEFLLGLFPEGDVSDARNLAGLRMERGAAEGRRESLRRERLRAWRGRLGREQFAVRAEIAEAGREGRDADEHGWVSYLLAIEAGLWMADKELEAMRPSYR